jgi:cation diffusion facilitator family transporter
VSQTETNSPRNVLRSVDQETRVIRRIALYAFGLNLGLAIMKGVLALLANSLAVTAGAIDSGTDAVASLLLYLGLRLSTRKTPSFPLGLYKIENLISVVVALFIFFAGFEIAREALIASKGAPDISMSIVVLLAAGTLAIYLFGVYASRVGQRTGSPTLMAEGKHRQVDVLASIAVVASALTSYFHWSAAFWSISIDKIAAAVVLIFIAWAGWELLVDGMRVLLDASVDFGTLTQASKILEGHPMVVKVSSLIGRNAGRFRFLQASIILRTGDLEKAHQVSQILEDEIYRKVPHVERVMIHYEPQPRTHVRIAVPMANREGLVSDHFGDSPCFAFVTVRLEDGAVEKRELMDNPHRAVAVAKGIRVAEWLVGQNVDQVVMKEDLSRKGPGYVLANAGIRSSRTAALRLEDAVEEAMRAVSQHPSDRLRGGHNGEGKNDAHPIG